MSSSTPAHTDVAAVDASTDFWVVLPIISEQQERERWAELVTPSALEVRGIDESYATQVRGLLTSLAELELDPPASWRLLHMVHPAIGAAIWQLAFLEPSRSISPASLVGAEDPGQLGSHVTEFEFRGLHGLQHVRFDLVDDAGIGGPADQAIEAVAATTTTRDLQGRPTTLLAVCRTVHLEALSISMESMQLLLTSPTLDQWAAEADS